MRAKRSRQGPCAKGTRGYRNQEQHDPEKCSPNGQKLNKAYSSKAFAKALKGVSKESRDADVAALNEIIEISMKLKNIIESID